MNYNLIAIILIYDLQFDLKLEALSLLKSQESTSIIFPSQKKKKNLYYFHYSPISENGTAIHPKGIGCIAISEKTFGTVAWVTQTYSLMLFLQSLLGVIL